jgi:hypothetical protein
MRARKRPVVEGGSNFDPLDVNEGRVFDLKPALIESLQANDD